MKNLIVLTVLCVTGLFLSGCVSSIGKEEFTCPNQKKGGACAGPRDIYELTNNRESLENLSVEDLHAQVHGHETENNKLRKNSQYSTDDIEQNNVYVPRTTEQHGHDNYQRAELAVTPAKNERTASSFGSWPNNGEPFAPEALAVMSQPKPMRIMINSFTDSTGIFHVPGYVYVNTQKSEWIKGDAASIRPTRVVPLELNRKATQAMDNVNRQRQGVSPLGVVLGQGR